MSKVVLEGVGKIYAGARAPAVVAVEPVDLRLDSGEFFCLVGPSGCGKSTLLNIMAGLLTPSEGTVHIDDRPVVGPNRRVGLVFQRPNLLRWLTVKQNVMLPSKIARAVTPEALARADQLLELAGLADFAKRYPKELSGGMQQRVAIVRSLVADPDVLLMDEPFSALDEFTRERMNDELLRLWAESPKTVIFVTHNIGEAVYLADRVGVMTPRPGRLKTLVDVQLPRPRRDHHRSDGRFHEAADRIRREFSGQLVSADEDRACS